MRGSRVIATEHDFRHRALATGFIITVHSVGIGLYVSGWSGTRTDAENLGIIGASYLLVLALLVLAWQLRRPRPGGPCGP